MTFCAVLAIFLLYRGGCSSVVESQIVDLVVAGSKPVIHLLRRFRVSKGKTRRPLGGKGAMDGAERVLPRPGISKQEVCEWRAKPVIHLLRRLGFRRVKPADL